MEALNSKFKGSLVSGTQETTFTLANINFDFSLFKVDPPKEYQALGKTLSKRRRDAAEDGSEHIFARKLGALFADSLPSTPNLHKAYGTRVSEIAKSPAANPQGSLSDGLFQDWVGADATSIWAAATSGSGAIAVHLLACMLARLWSASEAEAIWDELIESRKHELSKMDPSGPLNLATMAASRVEITREHIASWDASARAWISVADAAKRKEQTQLKLLIKDSALPINLQMNVYNSVMDAWKTAMVTVDKIISGMPHSIQDGAVLLGLSSWHLYPDMYSLGSSPAEVVLRDPLIAAGGIVTLSVSSHSPDNADGVYWSLPLAYLRYYGDPVHSCRVMGEVSTRLTISDCFQVILGSILAGWERNGDDFEQASSLIVSLWDYIVESRDKRSRGPRCWLQLIAEAAEAYTASEGLQRAYLESLISRGKRRHQNFLAEPSEQPGPIFGTSNTRILLSLISETENKIAALRCIAATFAVRNDPMLIRYRQRNGYLGDVWEYATALKKGHNPMKRKQQPDIDPSGHSRWVYSNSTYVEVNESKDVSIGVSSSWTFSDSTNVFISEAPRTISAKTHFQVRPAIEIDEHSSTQFSLTDNTTYLAEPSHETFYELIFGDPNDAAIFTRSESVSRFPSNVDIQLIDIALKARWLDPAKVIDHLDSPRTPRGKSTSSTYLKSLRGFAAAANAYMLMPSATVAASLFSKTLGEAWWVSCHSEMGDSPTGATTPNSETSVATDSIFQTWTSSGLYNTLKQTPLRIEESQTCKSLTAFTLSRNETFACIAMFENRNVNIRPNDLDQVMALSVGNSIFVAMPLLCDPFDNPFEHEMKHIVGNIGKPGISLMIPPKAPKVRKMDVDKWYPVSHTRFNGQYEDSFQNTTMHLSFSRYKMPASVISHGDQAVEANFIETLVSVFDRDKWLADLDIIGSLRSHFIICMGRLDSCQHEHRAQPLFPLSCIDSWYEYLDEPLGPAIFRAHKNMIARLSVTALNAQRGFRTILLRDDSHVCWGCLKFQCDRISTISISAHGPRENAPIFIC